MIAQAARRTPGRQVALWFFSLVALTHTQASAAGHPFVSGFERFARHGEIKAATAGRLLLTELSCVACHSAAAELQSKRGPNLDGVGNRVSYDWLTRFLSDPADVSPGTTMPDLLTGLGKRERNHAIAALVAFLVEKQKPFPELKGTGARPVPLEFWNHGQPERGRQLYHRIGCVACHHADQSYETVETKPTPLDQLLGQLDPEELRGLGLSAAARRVASVPHGDLAAKYSRQSLTFFLMDPHRVRPGGRMPNFKLTAVEASDVAAWLLRGQEDNTSPESESADVQKLVDEGARLFGRLGCANCHSLGDTKSTASARPLADLNPEAARSCIGKASKGIPHYQLDGQQKAAIKAGLDELNTIAKHTDPARNVQFWLLQLNCLACHERDKLGGVGRYRKAYFETYGHIDIGDEGRLPPPLTNAGSKLQSSWTAKVLQGTGVIRSHMRIRMPVFPVDQVKQLPSLLTLADFGQDRKRPTEAEVFGNETNLAEAGRQLLDTGCVQCHPLRTEALPGVVGVDLAGITGRVHAEWFRDFLLDPAALKPRTRMPTFFPGRKSQNSTVLDGDTDRQIAAMWAYLKDIGRQKLPSKIEIARSQNYELIPKDRPILLRTFMEEAGTHAIAVGFPEKIHFAYDAEGLYPAFGWKGRFLDARGTWFERFTPPARPLDTGGILLPRGVSFAEPLKPEASWPDPVEGREYRYLGHRIDKSGVPTFGYLFREVLIEDRMTPIGRGLLREVTLTDRSDSSSRSLQFLAHAGKELKRDGAQCRNGAELTVTLPKEFTTKGRVVDRDGRAEWRVPIMIEGKRVIEVRYEW